MFIQRLLLSLTVSRRPFEVPQHRGGLRVLSNNLFPARNSRHVERPSDSVASTPCHASHPSRENLSLYTSWTAISLPSIRLILACPFEYHFVTVYFYPFILVRYDLFRCMIFSRSVSCGRLWRKTYRTLTSYCFITKSVFQISKKGRLKWDCTIQAF